MNNMYCSALYFPLCRKPGQYYIGCVARLRYSSQPHAAGAASKRQISGLATSMSLMIVLQRQITGSLAHFLGAITRAVVLATGIV